MKKRSDFSAAAWSALYPDERYQIEQAEFNQQLGRGTDVVHRRAPDGRGVVVLDRATGQPIAAGPQRRMG